MLVITLGIDYFPSSLHSSFKLENGLADAGSCLDIFFCVVCLLPFAVGLGMGVGIGFGADCLP